MILCSFLHDSHALGSLSFLELWVFTIKLEKCQPIFFQSTLALSQYNAQQLTDKVRDGWVMLMITVHLHAHKSCHSDWCSNRWFITVNCKSWRGNQIKMRSLGWILIQYDWCFSKKGKFGNVHGGKMVWRDIEDGHLKDRGKEQILPSRPTEGTNLANTLLSGFQPPDLWVNKCLLLKPPSCW